MSGWTPERDALAIKLWTVDGFSAARIAKTIMGATRNAVIGRLTRLGYGGKGDYARKVAANRIAKSRAPVLKIAGRGTVFEEAVAHTPTADLRPEAFAPLPGVQPIPFIDRNWSHCAWPVGGEGTEMLCCGAKRDGEGPYCGAHRRSATQAVRPGSPRNGNELARSLRRYA